MRTSGTLLCLASAAAFGAMAVFGKLAFENGVTVGTLLAVRFLLAAVLFWSLLLVGGAAAEVRALPRRDVALALGLGAVGYAGQAGAFFAALERIDASLLSLLVYTYPALGLGAAVVYTAYILVGERVAARMRPGVLATLVSTGAAATLTAGATVVLAFLVFTETLGAVQLLGGALLLSGVLALHVRLPEPHPHPKEIADAGTA
jgi:drug/metabolite transporter (DMT)-like permease